jgi:hypothetical protein
VGRGSRIVGAANALMRAAAAGLIGSGAITEPSVTTFAMPAGSEVRATPGGTEGISISFVRSSGVTGNVGSESFQLESMLESVHRRSRAATRPA